MKIDELNYYEKSLLYTKFAQFIEKLEDEADCDEKYADEHLKDARDPEGIVNKNCWDYTQYENFTKEAEALLKVILFLQDIL